MGADPYFWIGVMEEERRAELPGTGDDREKTGFERRILK